MLTTLHLSPIIVAAVMAAVGLGLTVYAVGMALVIDRIALTLKGS